MNLFKKSIIVLVLFLTGMMLEADMFPTLEKALGSTQAMTPLGKIKNSYDNQLYDQAINLAQGLLKIGLLPNPESVALANMYLGASYLNKKDYPNAIAYSKLALNSGKLSSTDTAFAAKTLEAATISSK